MVVGDEVVVGGFGGAKDGGDECFVGVVESGGAGVGVGGEQGVVVAAVARRVGVGEGGGGEVDGVSLRSLVFLTSPLNLLSRAIIGFR